MAIIRPAGIRLWTARPRNRARPPMLRRVRTPLLLVALLLALLTGSYWLWHGLRTANDAKDSGAPTLE